MFASLAILQRGWEFAQGRAGASDDAGSEGGDEDNEVTLHCVGGRVFGY